MNYIKFFFSTIFIISTFFTAFAQDITLHTQAEVDAFDKSITSIKGDLIIGGYNINSNIKNVDGLSRITTVGGSLKIEDNNFLTNLDGLSGLTTVGSLVIGFNNSLTNLDGLSQLTTVGIDIAIGGNHALRNVDGLSGVMTIGEYLGITENSSLADCCGIQALLFKAGGIQVTIDNNATTCDNKAAILSANCKTDTPDEGEEVKESDYKKNLYSLTRWELKDCGNVANYKFAADNTYILSGGSSESGTYNVEGKTLTITANGSTAKTYTIIKMTRNVMHLNDASGAETIYGRKQHFSTDKLSGTNWKEQGGAHGDMRMKFLDASNVELITIGSKGSKMAATYTINSDNNKMTITLKDAAKAKAQGFSSTTLDFNVATFNYMMMKLTGGGDGETCFNRTR